jgi:hypothetical protein
LSGFGGHALGDLLGFGKHLRDRHGERLYLEHALRLSDVHSRHLLQVSLRSPQLRA